METDFSPTNYYRAANLTATRIGSLPQEQAEGVDSANKIDLEKVARGVRMILEGLGEDVDREGIAETPARVARMYQELTYGIGVEAASEITCTFNEPGENLVLVKDIPFASMCEHHLIPFVGCAHVAYVPARGKITGLSKLARVVELTARRLQVQERMTAQIADALVAKLTPHGVLVVLEAEHYCMTLRGIKKQGSKTLTTAARGVLKDSDAQRAEVLMLLSK